MYLADDYSLYLSDLLLMPQEHYSVFDEDGDVQHLSAIQDHLTREIDGKEFTYVYHWSYICLRLLLAVCAASKSRILQIESEKAYLGAMSAAAASASSHLMHS